jgi:type IV pilus assembly protein PilY1
MSTADKADTDVQYLIGIKDRYPPTSATCTQTTESGCVSSDLLDVTTAQICVSCTSGTQVSGVGTTTTFAGLVDQIQGNSVLGITAKDGWFIVLPTSAGPAERSVVNPTLIGGALFMPTFTPNTDICVAAGSSNLYAMYYKTGTAYSDPILGVNGAGVSNRVISLGEGLASSVAIQIGAQPTGMAGFYQSSNSVMGKVAPKPPIVLWSQILSWIGQRA